MGLKFQKADAVALGLAVGLMAATVMLSGRGQPSVKSVSGHYKSDCCGEMTVAPDSVTYDGERTSVRFYHMKFGLTAYAAQPFGPFYARQGIRRDPPVLYFDGATSFAVVSYKGRSAKFVRAD